jgi:hypothetical protein
MDMTRFLVGPEWPIPWLLDCIAERLIKERRDDDDIDDVEEIFEAALNAFIPPDRPGSSVR